MKDPRKKITKYISREFRKQTKKKGTAKQLSCNFCFPIFVFCIFSFKGEQAIMMREQYYK